MKNEPEYIPSVFAPIAYFVRHFPDEIETESADFTLHDIGCRIRIRERQEIKGDATVSYLYLKAANSAAADQFNLSHSVGISVMTDVDEGFLYGNQKAKLFILIETEMVCAPLDKTYHCFQIPDASRPYERMKFHRR